MKKRLLLSITFMFFLFISIMLGCTGNRSVFVENKSTQTITYNIKIGSNMYINTIESGETKMHTVYNLHDHFLESYQSVPIHDSVLLTESNDVYIFYSKEPSPAIIYNSLSKDVILTANGAISTDLLTVLASQEILTETILSNNPMFSAYTIDGFPVQVNFNLDNNIYKIILR